MRIIYPEIGICGLSCRLCPNYHINTEGRCKGCKSKDRMAVGCPFITCAIKKKYVEFCWLCDEHEICERWKERREFGKRHDSFKCYQRLDDDINYIMKNGAEEFKRGQIVREKLLRKMLKGFNEGRSKSYYCIAATVMEVEELKNVLNEAEKNSTGLDAKVKSKILHALLDEIAGQKNYYLKLRGRR